MSFLSDELPDIEIIASQHGRVRFVNHDERRSGIDALIIPGKVGVIPTLRGFERSKLPVFPKNPCCPKITKFFETTFAHYDELGTPIIGIGDAACYIWDYLGFQLNTTRRGVMMIMPEKKDFKSGTIEASEEPFVERFRFGHLMGINSIENLKFSNMLGNIAQQVRQDVEETQQDNEFAI